MTIEEKIKYNGILLNEFGHWLMENESAITDKEELTKVALRNREIVREFSDFISCYEETLKGE